ncbi:methyltransferase domain-containing protein [Pendulispora brunnea]|uniref:Methyltransferase domain-containing protein n=1 Tax=Pendulispora brunnea TaxID=2905690 RepID=A0ABZ2KN37_9BACT
MDRKPNELDDVSEDRYATGFLSKDIPTELTRLRTLETWSDPVSKAMILQRGIRPNWSCLEMGAGAGSMSYWLAEQCPEGRIVAADNDPRYLEDGRAPNLEIARVDLTKHEFPPASFDLVHARFLLSHLAPRNDIVRRAVQWLAPGGTLLVEDYYVLPIEEIPNRAWRELMDGVKRAFLVQGSDTQWVRQIPSLFVELGLEDLRIDMTPVLIGQDNVSNEVWSLGLAQFVPFMLEKGLITREQVAAYHAQPQAARVDLPFATLSVSARRGEG